MKEGLWSKFVKWLRKILRRYEKEVRQFVDEMLEFAFANLDEARKERLTPAIKKKVRNKVLADILVMGVDIATTKGKSEVGKLILDATDWFIGKEAE